MVFHSQSMSIPRRPTQVRGGKPAVLLSARDPLIETDSHFKLLDSVSGYFSVRKRYMAIRQQLHANSHLCGWGGKGVVRFPWASQHLGVGLARLDGKFRWLSPLRLVMCQTPSAEIPGDSGSES